MTEKRKSLPPDIHYVQGVYYNYNGVKPDKPLSVPYAKRLLAAQKKYGDNVTTAEARGHDDLSKKGKAYKDLAKGKNIKKSAIDLHKINLKTKVAKLNKRDKSNLRTRFQFGFRILDEMGDTINNPHGSFATDGIINFKFYVNKIPDYCFENNSFGGFSYVVYDKTSKEVVYNVEYNNED